MTGWKESLTDKDFVVTTGAIFAGEVGASIGAIFVTPLLDKFLHQKDNPIRKKVADWVEPHVKEIEQSSFHKELHALGEEEGEKKKQSYHALSKRGRAEKSLTYSSKAELSFWRITLYP